jgi:hypothetical protein
LQKRAGTIWTSTGCPVCSSALATILNSRSFRVAAFQRPRKVDLRGIAISSIESQGIARKGSKRLFRGLREAARCSLKGLHSWVKRSLTGLHFFEGLTFSATGFCELAAHKVANQSKGLLRIEHYFAIRAIFAGRGAGSGL